MKTLSLGSVATDITSPRQVFVICLALLTDVSPTIAARHSAKPIAARIQDPSDLSMLDTYRLNRAVSAIISDLNTYTPALAYFGYHPVDKSQIGVYVDTGALHTAEQNGMVTQVFSDDWRGIHSTFVLRFHDKGLTLYRRRGKSIVWTAS